MVTVICNRIKTILRWLDYHVMALPLDIPFDPSCQCLLGGDSVLSEAAEGPTGSSFVAVYIQRKLTTRNKHR